MEDAGQGRSIEASSDPDTTTLTDMDIDRPDLRDYLGFRQIWCLNIHRNKADCGLDVFDDAELATPSVDQRTVKAMATRNVGHRGIAGQSLGHNSFLGCLCKLASPDAPSQNLKPMNRHVVILVVCNVAIALTSRKQREFFN
jgi:hypothetical protein